MAEKKMDAAVKFARRAAKVAFDDFTPEEVHAAKRSILDCIGVMIAGAEMGFKVKDVAKYIQAKGGAPEATLIGYGGKYPTNSVAMANGGFAHTMDYDDAVRTGSHPTASCVPIVLAEGERRGHLSGKEFITSVIVGNDLLIRLSHNTPQVIEQGWLGPQLKGGFAATLAAAKALDLDANQMASALGIALNQASGIGQALSEGGNDLRELYQCFNAKVGVFAAEMAELGIVGCSDSFEGVRGFIANYFTAREPRPIMSYLDVDDKSPWLVADATFKPYSSCLCTHYYIDAMRQLMAEHPEVTKDAVKEIHVYTAGTSELLVQPEEARMSPANGNDARFSIPFTLGLTVAYGRPTLANFTPEGILDPLARGIAHLVTWEHSDELEKESEETGICAGVLDVTLTDGTKLSSRCDYSKGNLENPMTDDELLDKFRDCCSHAVKPLSDSDVDKLADMLLHLEDLEDISSLIELMA